MRCFGRDVDVIVGLLRIDRGLKLAGAILIWVLRDYDSVFERVIKEGIRGLELHPSFLAPISTIRPSCFLSARSASFLNYSRH